MSIFLREIEKNEDHAAKDGMCLLYVSYVQIIVG